MTDLAPEIVKGSIESLIAMSPDIGKLAEALAKAQAEMESAKKDSVNPHFKSKFADLASVWAAAKPLALHGLAVIQAPRAEGTKVTVTTMLCHSSGQWIQEALTMKAAQDTPQGIGSAITYARRYGLSAMTGITQDDDDGNTASQSSGKPSAAAPKPAAAAAPATTTLPIPYTASNEQKTVIRNLFAELGFDTKSKETAKLMKECSDLCVEEKVELPRLRAAVEEFVHGVEVRSGLKPTDAPV